MTPLYREPPVAPAVKVKPLAKLLSARISEAEREMQDRIEDGEHVDDWEIVLSYEAAKQILAALEGGEA